VQGDAELIYGDFRAKLSPDIRLKIFAATKWCIFHPVDVPFSRDWVLDAVRERVRRLGGTVQLLQFHWYDYEDKLYLRILAELVSISKMNPELVKAIGLCNFDTKHLEEVCQHLLDVNGQVGIVSNQVQFSLFDARPLFKMSEVCQKYGVKLLTYGSFVRQNRKLVVMAIVLTFTVRWSPFRQMARLANPRNLL
jgi:aryl-alcohol dehydrogenase-like predicted oxidoreductase